MSIGPAFWRMDGGFSRGITFSFYLQWERQAGQAIITQTDDWFRGMEDMGDMSNCKLPKHCLGYGMEGLTLMLYAHSLPGNILPGRLSYCR